MSLSRVRPSRKFCLSGTCLSLLEARALLATMATVSPMPQDTSSTAAPDDGDADGADDMAIGGVGTPDPEEDPSYDGGTPAPQTPPPAATPPTDVTKATDQLNKSPDAKTMLDDFKKRGGTVVQGNTNYTSGAQYDPTKDVITIDPKKAGNTDRTAGFILFELERAKNRQQQLDLDAQAKAGTLTPDQYATAAEKNTYDYLKDQQRIASDAVAKGQWNGGSDIYKQTVKDYPDFDTFLQNEKNTKHYDEFVQRAKALAK